MKRLLASSLAAGASVCLCASSARAADSAEALDELRQGYSLKVAGRCADALPHLARSFQLEPSARAALNLSDCEQQLGDLVAAQVHAAQGADLAHQQKNGELVGVADAQLAAIEKRLPRLTVKLVDGAPDCSITRDGVVLPGPALGTPIAINAGAHVIDVDCPGRADRRFDVSVADADRTETAVSPGAVLAAPTPPTPAPPPALESPPPRAARGGSARVMPVVVMGIGAAGLAVGLVSGVAANSKHASLLAHCSSDGICPMTERDDISAFHTLRTVSTVAYVIGGAALAGGAVWWFLAPASHPDPAAARLWIGPGSAGIGGSFR